MDSSLSVLRVLQILEMTDPEFHMDINKIRSRLILLGIRENSAGIRRDIGILKRSGRRIKEEKDGFWMV